jgi:hypothetical protein
MSVAPGDAEAERIQGIVRSIKESLEKIADGSQSAPKA